jgi:TonB family protein
MRMQRFTMLGNLKLKNWNSGILFLIYCLILTSMSMANGLIKNANKTVTDTITGLVWMQSVSAKRMSLIDAKKAASEISIGGKTGWHVPSERELRSITDRPALSLSVFALQNGEYLTTTFCSNCVADNRSVAREGTIIVLKINPTDNVEEFINATIQDKYYVWFVSGDPFYVTLPGPEDIDLSSDNSCRSYAEISQAIHFHKSELNRIYVKKARISKNLEGSMSIKLHIPPAGSTENAMLSSSTIEDTGFENKILESVKSWKFMPIKSGQSSVVFRIRFNRLD